ncbi:DUF6058 family natural product biosynthesis protein [Tenacibaculum xiamenense]|uniref:DUF6058 family natural product biosynthesis protein n=1 Tax=Tenacibaculum xiamenense TaxID=1261553 RepID=UPI003892EC1F
MKTDLEYIEENYIELRDLCSQCEISKEELAQLTENKLIPKNSYEVKSTHVISSPLGDETVLTEIKKYYHKSIVDLIDKNRRLNNMVEFREDFKHQFIDSFKKHKNKFAYGGIVDDNGNIDEKKLDDAFEEEWQYYLQGIYGICTLNNSPQEIARKEIAVKRLINFIEVHGEGAVNEELKLELKEINDDFNAVSNLFAPYQRKTSSRGKYLDKMLELNSLNELKKKYE